MINFSEIEKRITAEIPLEELEARLRPQEPTHEESTWNDHSGGGFLAPQERLLEVVRADYDTLSVLGKSYEEMAQLAAICLKQVGEINRENLREKSWREKISRWLERKPTVVVKNDGPKIDTTRFHPMLVGSFGIQSCPWGCQGLDSFGYSTLGGGHVYVREKEKQSFELMDKYEKIWDETWNMKFPELSPKDARAARERVQQERERSIGLEFGGMNRMLYLSYFTVITGLTPHLIASHYFFQGEASYRTDPKKLLQVMGLFS